MSKEKLHYDINHITFLEKLWGDGFMSPGGKKEIERLLKDLDLNKKKNSRYRMWGRRYFSKLSQRLWCARGYRN